MVYVFFHPSVSNHTDVPGFYINLPIGAVVSIFLLAIKIPDRIDRTSTEKRTTLSILLKFDIVGFFLFAPSAIMLLMALEWGGTEYPWNSATVIGLFCGAGGTFILFLAWEYRAGDSAMIPLSMVKKRIVWCSCLVIGFFFGSLLVFSYYLPIYFQAVKGVSPSRSGVYVLPGILSQMLMAVTSGFLGKCCSFLTRVPRTDMASSWETGILSSVEPCQCNCCRHFLRLDIHFQTKYQHCGMGGLSVPCRYRPRVWSSNGQFLPPSTCALSRRI